MDPSAAANPSALDSVSVTSAALCGLRGNPFLASVRWIAANKLR